MSSDTIARHLSIFVENKPGKLERITGILAEAGINVRAFSVADAGEYGVVKVLVDNPDKACSLLADAKITAASKHVLAVGVQDKPGGLHNLLTVLSENNINIEDSYGFVMEEGSTAVIILEITETDAADAEKKLSDQGFRLYTEKELYALP